MSMRDGYSNEQPIDWPIPLSADLRSRLWHAILEQDCQRTWYRTSEEALALLLAILYRARTGVEWEEVPKPSPPPRALRETYEQWGDTGLLARLSSILGIQLTDV
jgi:hypothetical protein